MNDFFLKQKQNDEKHHLIVDVDLEGMKESFSGLGIGSNSPLKSPLDFPGATPGPIWIILPPIGKDNSLKSLDKNNESMVEDEILSLNM